MLTKEEILIEKAKNILKNEGAEDINKTLSEEELLAEFILPGLANSKDIISSLYSAKTRTRTGVIGKIKGFIHQKLINIVINVLERPLVKQQKFNELAYKAISILQKKSK